ncbi:hypothetical protein Bca4012_092104 [Brassica carinata]|uniref:Uncharacterized protein n=3 Tax=Brassica TaxID=3705 RepID=A0A0D3DJM4_BRAOL|nr:unnamed protein product [Brassica napus]VDD54034.1 unnamed protein product [Brassica oleracea]
MADLEDYDDGASRSKLWQRRTKKSTALSKIVCAVSKVSKKNLRLGHSKEKKDEGGQRRTWLRAWLKRQVCRKTVTPELLW